MKFEVDNCRNQNWFHVFIESTRENYRIIKQVWEISVSTFSRFKMNKNNVIQVVSRLRTCVMNNQQNYSQTKYDSIKFVAENA
jgi:hypothetical protein